MRILSKIIMCIAVGLTWLMLLYVLSLLNWIMLVPWDAAVTLPDIGTWQRTINDFFEGRLGVTIIIMFSTAITALPILNTLRRRWDASLRVLVANLLFTFVGFFLVTSSFPLSHWFISLGERFYDPVYHRYLYMILPFITMWILYAVWLREINDLGKQVEKQKNKSKNTSEQEAIQRLTSQLSESHSDFQIDVASSERLASQ